MNTLYQLAVILFAALSASAFAADIGPTPKPGPRPGQGQDQNQGPAKPCQESDQHRCKPDQDGKRIEHFNLVCYYDSEHAPEGFKACKVGVVFDKVVTADGGEVPDISPLPVEPLSPEIPLFNVECDGHSKFKDYGRRFTDLLSTRIQALSGPKPAIYLGRGELSVGQHVADSYLEVDAGAGENHPVRAKGQCYIWTGPANPVLE